MALPVTCGIVHPVPQEEKAMSLHVRTESKPPVIPFTQYSKFSHLTHVTTCILQFIHNCHAKKCQIPKQLSLLAIQEIQNVETNWMSVIQCQHFSQEINTAQLSKCYIPLHLLLDPGGLLHVGSRISNSTSEFSSKHTLTVHVYAYCILSPHCCLALLVADFMYLVVAEQFSL